VVFNENVWQRRSLWSSITCDFTRLSSLVLFSATVLHAVTRWGGNSTARFFHFFLRSFTLIMAVESKKNETSAEKSVKTEASNGDEPMKLNGEGKFHYSYPSPWSLRVI